eukprot:TRINITY_DN2089_c1_g2_i1.p1 TRINITY_DN2089_c1_g2~~TRINITY_DN2089_c1_g2_i1.p1  ORF type:complete len:1159 (-),score=156.68 TRINITY_DN2089_c1_g2_i1:113-3589(-)
MISLVLDILPNSLYHEVLGRPFIARTIQVFVHEYSSQDILEKITYIMVVCSKWEPFIAYCAEKRVDIPMHSCSLLESGSGDSMEATVNLLAVLMIWISAKHPFAIELVQSQNYVDMMKKELVCSVELIRCWGFQLLQATAVAFPSQLDQLVDENFAEFCLETACSFTWTASIRRVAVKVVLVLSTSPTITAHLSSDPILGILTHYVNEAKRESFSGASVDTITDLMTLLLHVVQHSQMIDPIEITRCLHGVMRLLSEDRCILLLEPESICSFLTHLLQKGAPGKVTSEQLQLTESVLSVGFDVLCAMEEDNDSRVTQGGKEMLFLAMVILLDEVMKWCSKYILNINLEKGVEEMGNIRSRTASADEEGKGCERLLLFIEEAIVQLYFPHIEVTIHEPSVVSLLVTLLDTSKRSRDLACAMGKLGVAGLLTRLRLGECNDGADILLYQLMRSVDALPSRGDGDGGRGVQTTLEAIRRLFRSLASSDGGDNGHLCLSEPDWDTLVCILYTAKCNGDMWESLDTFIEEVVLMIPRHNHPASPRWVLSRPRLTRLLYIITSTADRCEESVYGHIDDLLLSGNHNLPRLSSLPTTAATWIIQRSKLTEVVHAMIRDEVSRYANAPVLSTPGETTCPSTRRTLVHLLHVEGGGGLEHMLRIVTRGGKIGDQEVPVQKLVLDIISSVMAEDDRTSDAPTSVLVGSETLLSIVKAVMSSTYFAPRLQSLGSSSVTANTNSNKRKHTSTAHGKHSISPEHLCLLLHIASSSPGIATSLLTMLNARVQPMIHYLISSSSSPSPMAPTTSKSESLPLPLSSASILPLDVDAYNLVTQLTPTQEDLLLSSYIRFLSTSKVGKSIPVEKEISIIQHVLLRRQGHSPKHNSTIASAVQCLGHLLDHHARTATTSSTASSLPSPSPTTTTTTSSLPVTDLLYGHNRDMSLLASLCGQVKWFALLQTGVPRYTYLVYTTLEKWIRSHRAIRDKETTAEANGDRRRDSGIPLEHSTCEEYLFTVVNLLITNCEEKTKVAAVEFLDALFSSTRSSLRLRTNYWHTVLVDHMLGKDREETSLSGSDVMYLNLMLRSETGHNDKDVPAHAFIVSMFPSRLIKSFLRKVTATPLSFARPVISLMKKMSKLPLDNDPLVRRALRVGFQFLHSQLQRVSTS